MKIIKPSVEIIQQEPQLYGIYKQIEIVGRNCYKSESKITDNSAGDFMMKMIESRHMSMLEHGTLYLDFSLGDPLSDDHYARKSEIIRLFSNNRYSRVNKYIEEKHADVFTMNITHYAITTNMRVIEEQIPWDENYEIEIGEYNGKRIVFTKDDILSYMTINNMSNPYHDKRFTLRIICDRGVTHELVRHRAFSFAQESTRYCNYGKDKFGNELTFIEPSWFNNNDSKYTKLKTEFIDSCVEIEKNYLNMINSGASAQEARAVLSNAIKTEIIVTAFETDWSHFIDLRSEGTTGMPHPDMKIVADMVKEILNL